MVAEPSKAIKIFYCYAQEDMQLLLKLEKQLSPLRRVRSITGWYDRNILLGTDRALEIETQFNTAHIVLLLLSPDFCASDDCYILMEKAVESHNAGKIHVVPILLRPLIWDTLPISALELLPHDRRAVTTWSNQDEAFEDVARGIRERVRTLLPKHLLSLQETGILYSEELEQSIHPEVNTSVASMPAKAPEGMRELTDALHEGVQSQPITFVLGPPLEARNTISPIIPPKQVSRPTTGLRSEALVPAHTESARLEPAIETAGVPDRSTPGFRFFPLGSPKNVLSSSLQKRRPSKRFPLWMGGVLGLVILLVAALVIIRSNPINLVTNHTTPMLTPTSTVPLASTPTSTVPLTPTPTSTATLTPTPVVFINLGPPGLTVSQSGAQTYSVVIQAKDSFDHNKLITADGITCRIWLVPRGDEPRDLSSLPSELLEHPENFNQPFPLEIQNALVFDPSTTNEAQICIRGTAQWKFTISPSVPKGDYCLMGLTDWQGKRYNWSWYYMTVS